MVAQALKKPRVFNMTLTDPWAQKEMGHGWNKATLYSDGTPLCPPYQRGFF